MMKNSVKYIFSVLLLFALLACTKIISLPLSFVEDSQIDLSNKINQILINYEKQGFSGSVLIAKGKEVFYHKSFGVADRESNRPVTNDTRFEIMSITKTFVAAGILQLKEKGLLNLEDPIEKYLGEMPKEKKTITVRQLLNHTSGLPANGGEAIDKTSRNNYLNSVKKLNLEFTPGKSFLYSNVAFGLGAFLIEEITGESFKSYCRANLFKKAGMNKTAFSSEFPDSITAVGYAGILNYYNPYPAPNPKIGTLGATGIISTVDDLHRWITALLNGKILSAKLVNEMFTSHNKDHGLSWDILKTENGIKKIFKDGGWPSYQSMLIFYPETEYIVAFTANSYRGWREIILNDIENLLFNDKITISNAIVELNNSELTKHLGKYEIDESNFITIETLKKSLLLTASGVNAKNILGYKADEKYPQIIIYPTSQKEFIGIILRPDLNHYKKFNFEFQFDKRQRAISMKISDSNLNDNTIKFNKKIK